MYSQQVTPCNMSKMNIVYSDKQEKGTLIAVVIKNTVNNLRKTKQFQ
jgi:hypothetical protein